MLKLRDGTKKSESNLITHSNMHQTNQQVGQYFVWSTFSARTSHGQLRTHKTHHGPDSREATTFSHIVFFAPLRGTYIQMAFCLGTPKEQSRNYQNLDYPPTLRDYNSSLKPLIETSSKEKLQLSSKAFQWCVALHLHTWGLGRFSTFRCQESNWQFDSRPFFLP